MIMKYRNRIITLLVGMTMLLFMSVPAFAAEYTLDSGECDFDGEQLTANFDGGDLVDSISTLEPGDSLELTVKYSNSSDKTVDYYMSATTLQTLEESKDAAKNGGYRFVLKDSGPNGETVLFDNSEVGGDTVIAGLEGLKQATNATQSYFFIHKLAPGQKGQTYLRVEFEEETQANDYMDTVGKLRLSYAAEIDTSGGNNGNNKTYENNPRTGDSSDLLKYLMMMTAALLIGILAFISRRKDRKDGDEA